MSSLATSLVDHWRDWTAFGFFSATVVAAAAAESACGIGSEQCVLDGRWAPGTEYADAARCYDPVDGDRVRYGDTVFTLTSLTRASSAVYLSSGFFFTPLAVVIGAATSYSMHSNDLASVYDADLVSNMIILACVFGDFTIEAYSFPESLRRLCLAVPGRRLLLWSFIILFGALVAIFAVSAESLDKSGKNVLLTVWSAVVAVGILYLGWNRPAGWKGRGDLTVAFVAFLGQVASIIADAAIGSECTQQTLFASAHTWDHLLGAVVLIFVGRALWKNGAQQLEASREVGEFLLDG